MANSWQDDKRWSDRFIPLIKPILGTYLIGPSPVAEDQIRNTDLIVLRMESLRIACRIRRPEYAEKYYDEFTIRLKRESGVETELSKIVKGWGDYFFYGFADPTECRLGIWFLGDLRVFRLWLMRELCAKKQLPGRCYQNHEDGGSSFMAFNRKDLPAEFFTATSQLHEDSAIGQA